MKPEAAMAPEVNSVQEAHSDERDSSSQESITETILRRTIEQLDLNVIEEPYLERLKSLAMTGDLVKPAKVKQALQEKTDETA